MLVCAGARVDTRALPGQGLEVLGRSVLLSFFFSCLPPPGVQRAVTIFLGDNRRSIFLVLQDGLLAFFLVSPLVLHLPEKRSASNLLFPLAFPLQSDIHGKLLALVLRAG